MNQHEDLLAKIHNFRTKPNCICHQLMKQNLPCLKLDMSCLRLKSWRVENLLGVIMHYAILGDFRLG